MIIFILSVHILSLVLILYSIRNPKIWWNSAYLGLSSIFITIFSVVLGALIPVKIERLPLPTIEISVGQSQYVFTVYDESLSAPEKKQENKMFYKEMSWSFYGFRLHDQILYK